MTDEHLAEQARRGSLPAFEALVRRHQSVVRGFLRRLGGDHPLADDLAQDVFVTAWRKLDRFDGRGTFRGWLCRIAYTTFLQDRRASGARARREEASLPPPDLTGGPEGALDLERALATLSDEQRAAVALCYGEGLSHTEAADALGVPLGTLKSHVLRRERLVALLRAEEAS